MRRMTCYLATAVAAQMPGATFTPVPPSRFNAPAGNKPLEAFGRLSETAQHPFTSEKQMQALPDNGTDLMTFMAHANVADAEGAGSISFIVGSFTPKDKASLTQDCVPGHLGPGFDCQIRTGPQGQTVMVRVITNDGGLISLDVLVFSGHTQVMAMANNFVISEGRGSTATRATPPLDHDQLLKIASAPELVLFR
jgi:hypothetical protein